jgi:uncharacterized damage-inducible protein DinB
MNPRELLIETLPHIHPDRALEGLIETDAERRLAGVEHSIAAIVAHMGFWQDWFCRRCDGAAEPMAATAAHGWPEVKAGSWLAVRAQFAAGLERAVALGERRNRPIEPPIEFDQLAHYTIGDALVHIAQHNSHHLGQVILLRQMMALWPPPAGSWTW